MIYDLLLTHDCILIPQRHYLDFMSSLYLLHFPLHFPNQLQGFLLACLSYLSYCAYIPYGIHWVFFSFLEPHDGHQNISVCVVEVNDLLISIHLTFCIGYHSSFTQFNRIGRLLVEGTLMTKSTKIRQSNNKYVLSVTKVLQYLEPIFIDFGMSFSLVF